MMYGMGEKKTPKPFIVACDKFVYIEVIRAAAKQAAEAAKKKEEAQAKKTAKKENKKCQTSSSPARRRSWSSSPSRWRTCARGRAGHMGKLGNLLLKKQPDFDPRNYGFSKLSKLIRALDRFQIVPQGEENVEYYVRDICADKETNWLEKQRVPLRNALFLCVMVALCAGRSGKPERPEQPVPRRQPPPTRCRPGPRAEAAAGPSRPAAAECGQRR